MKKQDFRSLSWALLIGAVLFQSCTKDVESVEVELEPVRYKDFVADGVFTDFETFTEGPNGLIMDIYTPADGYTGSRPVILFAHGGSFVDGSRDLPDMKYLCNQFAKRGYLTATMSYRLGTINQVLGDSVAAADIVVKAVHDAKAAVRFLKRHAAKYNIDTGKVFVGGNSAGAVMMLHLAYLRDGQNIPSHVQAALQNNGGFEGNRGNSGFSSNVHAVISLAGGIARTEWVDNPNIPLVSLHGDADDIVPFNCNKVFFNFPPLNNRISLCGSGAIHSSLPAGFPADLYVYTNAGHVPWNGPDGNMNAQFAPGEKFIVDFLYERFFK
jgi:para-nitrobenzyl esterase